MMTKRINSLALAFGLLLCFCLVGFGQAGQRSIDNGEQGGGSVGVAGISSAGGGESQSERSSGSSNEFSNNKEAQRSSAHGHKVQLESGITGGGSENSKGDLNVMFNFNEYVQLIFSPFELVKKISEIFKLPQEKFIDKIGKGLIFGAEAVLTPMIASIKIIEKVFVPDNCRLKLICQIGSKFNFVKETLIKFSPNIFQEVHHWKALSYGMTGQDCEFLYKDCGEPKLKKPFEELKH